MNMALHKSFAPLPITLSTCLKIHSQKLLKADTYFSLGSLLFTTSYGCPILVSDIMNITHIYYNVLKKSRVTCLILAVSVVKLHDKIAILKCLRSDADYLTFVELWS